MRRRREIRSMKRKQLIALILCIATLVSIVLYFAVYNTVNKEVTIEVGSEITPEMFAKMYESNTSFVIDISWIDNTCPDTYEVYVKNTVITHKCELTIVDTIAPTATLFEGDWYIGNSITAESLILDATDVTAMQYELMTEIDYSNYEYQDVMVRITDRGDNFIELLTSIRIVPLVEEIRIEIGGVIPDSVDFVAVDGMDIISLNNMDEIDNMVLGSTEVLFEMGNETYSTYLVIEDTIAPIADIVEVEAYNTSILDATDFVTNIEDMTEVNVTFSEEIDMSINGVQTVKIELTDEGGNVTVLESVVTLEADTEAPEIMCDGGEIRNILGESIAYKKSITVTDNCDETIEIEFDNSEVDINTAGEYNVYCTATDLAGNVSEETFTVVIYEQDSVEAEVYEMADAVLESLIDDTMSEYEIVEAIYWYCKWNISYVGYSDKSDWITGAYDGLKYHSGDCFTYASMAKVLLTRAGITNMDISKIPAATEHYWNLVDIGDGWVHFDSCARSDGTAIFLWTTEEVLEYSNSHNLSHNFDPDEYPELYE